MLAMTSSTSLAFEETRGGVSPEPQKQVTDKPGKPLNLDGTGTSVDTPPRSGSELRIPGLGKLGVLPKFDFGLELLYGVNEQKPSDRELGRLDQSDDVQIRGSIKHKF